MEEYKDIPGYEGMYAVTKDGRVWSHPKETIVGGRGGVRVDGGRFLSNKPHHQGYCRVHIRDKNNIRKGMLVHRLVAMTYIPNPDALPFINHLNGDTQDNRVDNLEWCDNKRNTKHAYDNGWIKTPYQQGEANSQAKLTVDDARRIKELSAAGMGDTAISRETGISRSAVKDVTKGRTWRHI